MKNLFDVSGMISIITGGMGQLGSQFAETLLENGAKVAVFDINVDRKNTFYLAQEKNPNLKLYRVNVTNSAELKIALDAVVRDMGNPSILINNAAIDAPPRATDTDTGPFETYPEESWDEMVNVNLKGSFLCCQIIGGYMAKANGGSIINISSIYGILSPDQRIYRYKKNPFFKPIAYSVTKSGLLNMTRYLATYWAKQKVRVNTVVFAGVFNNQDDEFVKHYTDRVPLGRMAREDEYNGVIVFLSSDASSYITGSTLIVDGGWSAW